LLVTGDEMDPRREPAQVKQQQIQRAVLSSNWDQSLVLRKSEARPTAGGQNNNVRPIATPERHVFSTAPPGGRRFSA
jgi:hypothetical protein